MNANNDVTVVTEFDSLLSSNLHSFSIKKVLLLNGYITLIEHFSYQISCNYYCNLSFLESNLGNPNLN